VDSQRHPVSPPLLYFGVNVELSGWATITEKIMLKVKTIGQMLLFKSGTALPSPAQAPGSAIILFRADQQ